MLYRKIGTLIEERLKADSNKILVIDGARQIGKTYIIRETGKALFENYIEINLLEDFAGAQIFSNAKTTEDFYFLLSTVAGEKMKQKKNTLVFLDEIQTYPHLLTLLKFLKQDDRYTYVASGSLLGVTLAQTNSVPIGSIEVCHMQQLDFEEFLYACGFAKTAVETLRQKFFRGETPDENTHARLLELFRKYLLIGGMPDAVNAWLKSSNISEVRAIQNEIRLYYGIDAAKYDADRKLKIKRLYEMLPSMMQRKKKRVVAGEIEQKKNSRFENYKDEIDYLTASGIANEVRAVSTPVFPLLQNSGKNLLKLYLNDTGLLSALLYGNNIQAVLNDSRSVNLGALYETAVASELKAHGHALWYYDNRKAGEIDFLINDYETLSVVPIEVKSGRDYTRHSALNRFLQNEDYNVQKAYVLSNGREFKSIGSLNYIPVYDVMFL